MLNSYVSCLNRFHTESGLSQYICKVDTKIRLDHSHQIWSIHHNHGKFILCPFRNGDFCLLFISIFLNSVSGITAQNSVINSKNFVQRIFFELLYRVYKFPKFLGYVPYESPSIKYVPSEYWSFIHPIPPVCLDPLLMTPFPTTCTRFLPSPSTKKNFKEIAPFRFLPEKKSFVDFPLF